MVTMPHLRERLTENWLLAALPESEQEQLAHCLKLVPLTSQDVLVHQNEPVPALWFPLSAVVSLTASTRDGHVLQPALIGVDGVTGISLALGCERSPHQFEVDVPGEALRLARADYTARRAALPRLQRLILLYCDYLLASTSQWAACRVYHRAQQRCAGLLLQFMRLSGNGDFRLVQERLASSVGTHRPSVNAAMRSFRGAGLVQYQRGRVHIADVERLREAACGCHDTVAAEYESLFGRPREVAGVV